MAGWVAAKVTMIKYRPKCFIALVAQPKLHAWTQKMSAECMNHKVEQKMYTIMLG